MTALWPPARAAALLVAGVLIGSVAVPAPAFGSAGEGANTAGDPFFPLRGNGGYDVAHYDITLSFTPSSGAVEGVTKVRATATQALSRFDLDLRRGMTVSAVTVDGHRAAFSQPAALKQELVITPASTVRSGSPFTVAVTYSGVPRPVTDPDGSLDGWVSTGDGPSASTSHRAHPPGTRATTVRWTRPASTTTSASRRG